MTQNVFSLKKTGEILISGEIDENQPVVKNNLIYHYPCDGHAKSIIDKNILDYSTWVIGSSGSQPGFYQNGDGNSIVEYKDPFGNKTAVWQTLNNDSDSNADGGWNTPGFAIDNTQYYRFTTWCRRNYLGNGSFYLGCNGYGSTNGVYDSSGNLKTNPYFIVDNWKTIELNKWFLFVAFVYPHDYSGDLSVLHPDAGMWDTNGKIRTTNFHNFKWHPSSTSARHRSYLYYSIVPQTHQLWVYPRVDKCDGTEPTIEDLIKGFNGDGGCTNPLELSDAHITYSGVEISRECTNILPSPDINSLPTYGNGWGTYNVNQYNSGNYFNIGTIDNVTNNIVTLSTVDHPIYTYDVLRPQTTGGGVTAGTDYFIKKHSENSFSLHQYNSSQDGSQGYIVDGKGFKVHESIWSDNRISINATNFPTSWRGYPHRPNSSLVKEIIPLGYKGIHDCIRCHGEHRFGGYYSDSHNQDYMAYGVKPSVTEGDYYSVSFKIRNVTEVGCGKSFVFELWTSGSNSPVWMLNNFTLPNDTEWHEFVFYGTAPNTGTTNIYFKQPLYSTIDISEIFISKIYDYRSFTKNSKSFSHFKIPVNINLDSSPFTLIARVNPTNSIEYLIDKSYEVNNNTWQWRSLLHFHAGVSGRFDSWWSGSKTALINMCYPTDTSGNYTCPATGNHFADTEDDILIGYSFHGGRSFTVFTYRNGDIHYNNHTAGDDLGFLSTISLNGYSNSYLGGHIWKTILLYDTDLSLDDFRKLAQHYFSPQTNGDLIIKDTATTNEKLNNIETNSIYFPLSNNGNDEFNIFEPENPTNLAFSEESVFVGVSMTNASLNDGQTTSPWGGDGSPTLNIVDDEEMFRGRKVVRFHVGSSNNAYINGSGDLSTSISDTKWTSTCYIKRADGQPMPTTIAAYLYISNNTNVNSTIYPEYVGNGWYKCVYTRENLSSGYPTLAGFYHLPNDTDLFLADWQVENNNYSSPLALRTRGNGQLYYSSIPPYLDFNRGTIGCWFRPTKGFLIYNHTRVMGHGTSVNGNIIQIARYGSSQKFVFNISNDSSQPQTSWGTCQTADFTIDEWHFLVARWDVNNNVMDLTMNGVKYSNTLSSTYIPSVRGTFDIGFHKYYTRWSNSYIRDVFISKEYLSDTIIDKIYRNKLKINKRAFQCLKVLENETLS